MQGQSFKVKVSFYSGYKGEETPRSVLFRDKEISIDRILQRKRILNTETENSRDEYTIELKGRRAILKVFSSGECELTYLPQ